MVSLLPTKSSWFDTKWLFVSPWEPFRHLKPRGCSQYFLWALSLDLSKLEKSIWCWLSLEFRNVRQKQKQSENLRVLYVLVKFGGLKPSLFFSHIKVNGWTAHGWVVYVVYVLLVTLQHCETQATPTTNYIYIFFSGKEYKPTGLSSFSLPFMLLQIYLRVGNILLLLKGMISWNVFTRTFVP